METNFSKLFVGRFVEFQGVVDENRKKRDLQDFLLATARGYTLPPTEVGGGRRRRFRLSTRFTIAQIPFL
jgi:hypothetical protein